MARVKNAVASKRRKKRWLKRAKGFFGDRKNHIRQTKNAVMKAWAYNYEHRKKKKREFRMLWTIRINIAARMNGISYSKLINGLKKAGCLIDRKQLSVLAMNDKEAFCELVKLAKTSLAA